MSFGEFPAPGVRVVRDPQELASVACAEVTAKLGATLAERPEARVALAGGSTPLGLYRALAAEAGAVEWGRVRLFWSDERCVPPDHPDSNYRAVREALLSRLAPAPAGIHRIRGELAPLEAAERYERELSRWRSEDNSLFDLAILGIGADGHTASLFPGGAELESSSLVAASLSPVPPHARVTLTLRALNASRAILFLASGGSKSAAVARATSGTADPSPPAGRVRSQGGEVQWILDRDASDIGRDSAPAAGRAG